MTHPALQETSKHSHQTTKPEPNPKIINDAYHKNSPDPFPPRRRPEQSASKNRKQTEHTKKSDTVHLSATYHRAHTRGTVSRTSAPQHQAQRSKHPTPI
jgi:hypothetical protein